MYCDGVVVASGKTTVFGADAASGDHVHEIDFSHFYWPGKGYTLHVGEIASYPFDISGRLYDQLRYDAVEFFYHQRSGIPIEAKYVGDAHARPAGHLDVLPNLGDTHVPCLEGACDHSLDVRGGWYDAGDQGKYVVNGAISAWLLVNTYERAHVSAKPALRDGTQEIPERTNGIPDILDEARWEQEFILRMQVPDGHPRAGMVFRQIHDDQWTALGTPPDQDPMARHLHAPSTCATLNLAAIAAQGARVWRRWDPAFADRCLRAAQKAWQAALANPAVFTPPPASGGGDYNDSDMSDEFYWAAAELFVTTGKPEYRDYVTSSPHYQARGVPGDGFTWRDVSVLGDLSLSLVPNHLPLSEQWGLRNAIAREADRILETQRGQGYPTTYGPAGNHYYWGSNAQVLNQIVLLAAAHDLTWLPKYRDAAFEGMDYLLGRNALNQSYVTGYGTRFSQNQHHRFWAHQVNSTLPNPPAGALAGGPDSMLDDPTAEALQRGCYPQKCYIDNIQSYSTNEVAINWNAALAWVTAWLADHS